jgi:uncharacterized membrane protein
MVRTRDLATGGIVALIALVSVLSVPRLPEELAIHFDAAGEPDDYMQLEVALAGSVLLTGGIAVMFAVLPRIDPLGENFAEFQQIYDWFAVGMVAFMAYIHGLLLAYNLGIEFGMMQATAPAISALYLLVAVVLRRAEQNWFVGIRTPWTLSDERVWNRTHERTAPLFVVAAVFALGAAVIPEYATVLLVGPAAAIALVSTVYSFVVYQRLDHA